MRHSTDNKGRGSASPTRALRFNSVNVDLINCIQTEDYSRAEKSFDIPRRLNWINLIRRALGALNGNHDAHSEMPLELEFMGRMVASFWARSRARKQDGILIERSWPNFHQHSIRSGDWETCTIEAGKIIRVRVHFTRPRQRLHKKRSEETESKGATTFEMLQNCKVINVSLLLMEKIVVLGARDLSIPFVTSSPSLFPRVIVAL